MTTQCYRMMAYANPVRKRPEMISTWASTPSMGYAYLRPTDQIIKWRQETKGSATVNFDRSFRALSKREDSRPCASAQGRDGMEDEGCEGEWRGKLRGSPALLKLRRGKLRGGFDFIRTVISL